MTDIHRIDSHKLEFHPRRVAAWTEGKDWWSSAQDIYPIYVEVSPSGACNHRCTFCAVDYIGYKPVNLDADLLMERLHEMGKLGVKSVMFAGEGEPLLHKRINAITEFTARKADIDVAFTTNGVLLHKLETLHECTWVKLSINAGTRETYTKVHQTHERDWDRVWRNLEIMIPKKGACTVGVQMVVLPENEHEIPAMEALCADHGVDYLVLKPYSQHKMSITHQYEGWKPIKLETASKLSVKREAAFATDKIPYNKCSATPFFWAYIMASGDVYSCSAYLLDPRFHLGNINQENFRSIWTGEKRHANWEFVRKHLDISECRVNCRMDKANRYLDSFGKMPHANFI